MALYVKLKKKPSHLIKDYFLSIFWLNGFVRLYLEILLDGLIYTLINVKSELFINFALDGFSYLILVGFVFLVVYSTFYIIIYTRRTPIAIWKKSISEYLVETYRSNNGILMYHLIFIFRRVALAINVCLYNALGANTHLSLHVICQCIVVFLMMT